MQRALDAMNRRMGQAEEKRPLFGLGAPAGRPVRIDPALFGPAPSGEGAGRPGR